LLHTEGEAESSYYGESFLEEAIGFDEKQLRDYSPVYNVARLKAPVFIAHGEKDERAPIVHAEKLRDALIKSDKVFEWFVQDSEGHGFYSVDNNVELFERSVAFIKANTVSK